MTFITEPGVYSLPEDKYHRDPVPGGSLSQSGAKRLLECPAKYLHEIGQPRTPTAAMEFGTAVHKLVFGVGQDVTVVDADDWRTKAAKEAAASAREAGKVPLLSAAYEEALTIAGAVLAHPIAGKLFDPAHGDPEQSLFWIDPWTEVWMRARLDWLPRWNPDRRMIPADLKTCDNASPAAVAKAVAGYGYHLQAAHYTDGIRALNLDPGPAFVFVFVEKTPPYLVTVAQLDERAIDAGRMLMARAAEMFRDCRESGIWPGYDGTEDIITVSLPPWATPKDTTEENW